MLKRRHSPSPRASPSSPKRPRLSPKTRAAKDVYEGFKLRRDSLLKIYNEARASYGHGAYLIEGHGHYPLYKRSHQHEGYILQRPDPIDVPPNKAVIYLAEPGKCMWITTGRQLGSRYFGSESGIKDFISGKAELEGVHHADISRKAFVPGDKYLDSKVSLKPKNSEPAFGYVWKLPIEFKRMESDKYLRKDFEPRRGDVIGFSRSSWWVSDIVRMGPPGVYIVSSCLDAGPIPTSYNWPEAPVGYFPPAPKKDRKEAVKGAFVRKILGSILRPAIRKKPVKSKALTTQATRNVHGAGGSRYARFSHSPFPSNKNMDYTKHTRMLERENKAKLKQAVPRTTVREILGKLNNNPNINVGTFKNMPAKRSVIKNLRATAKALQTMRKSPEKFELAAPRSLRVAIKASKFTGMSKVPGLSASAIIYRNISQNPNSKFAKSMGRAPNTPQK